MEFNNSSSPPTGEDDFYDTRWLILTHLYRNYNLFSSSKKVLKEMLFFNTHLETRAAFEYLCDYCDLLEKAPAKITVMTELTNNHEHYAMPEQIRYVYSSRMRQVYDYAEKDLDVVFVEKIIQSEYKFFLSNRFSTLPKGLSEEELEKQARKYVDGMGADLYTNLNPTTMFSDLKKNLSSEKRTPIGVHFMDHMMGGGTLPGELIGVLAPSGGGKSTIAIMALAASVDRNAICWYFSTEQKLKGDLATRQACLATQSGRDKFKNGFENIPADIMQLLLSVQTQWEKNCKFVDISERRDIKSVDAIFSKVEQFHQKLGEPPGLIVVDWWGRLSDAMVMAQDTIPSGDDKRRFDRDELHKAKQWMERLGCPGALMHQLSGAANAKGPNARLSSADAQENKAFNNMFDFTVVLGNRNSEDIMKAVTDKARGEARAEINVKLKGLMCRIDIAEDIDALDESVYTTAAGAFNGDSGPASTDYNMNNAGI